VESELVKRYRPVSLARRGYVCPSPRVSDIFSGYSNEAVSGRLTSAKQTGMATAIWPE
jgi:hypothetical protein